MRRIATVLTSLAGLAAAACIHLPWNRADAEIARAARPGPEQIEPTRSSSLSVADVKDVPRPRADAGERADELIADARKAYAAVKTYRCTFVKRERVRNRLLPEEVMLMTVRAEPLAIHMKFLEPDSISGQEVCYNTAKSKTHLRAKSAGLAGAIGFINLKIDDDKAMATNRHTIAEGGIGGLINLAADARKAGGAVSASRFKFDKKPCTRVEFLAAAGDPKPYAARLLIYFDETSGLPIRMEAFGPPSKAAPEGDMLEQYNYTDLQINPEVNEALFSK
jgi:hypothetical protein